MDKNTITELENYIFRYKPKPVVAADAMADIIGVMIGVKPAAIIDYFDTTKEIKEMEPGELVELINRAGLEALLFTQNYFSMGEMIWSEDVYISHDVKTAAKLHQLFEKLHSSMDVIGQVFDREAWEESSREIGLLLGYPATAVDYFIAEQDIDNEERKQLMKRYQFYVHSPKHHEWEYQAYDQKILQALQEYAPRSAQILLDRKSH